ncbi:hypothetical protein Y1Q_0010493 [Alligator mississippiensis]|uniref:Uncharacterized protein n=1 Tax=Alligator mississippiensis TaxID=8496 RepID=A0A151ND81_ALLMI|nr:hypothetical protein Y1Q_0010493 [Alligator mississippiensis]
MLRRAAPGALRVGAGEGFFDSAAGIQRNSSDGAVLAEGLDGRARREAPRWPQTTCNSPSSRRRGGKLSRTWRDGSGHVQTRGGRCLASLVAGEGV